LKRTGAAQSKRAPRGLKPKGQAERDVAPERTLRDRDVVRLTEQIIDSLETAERKDAMARVAIGGMLRELREKIPHGEWLGWLETDVPFTPRTAWSYIQLHDWSKTHPVNFEKLASLGPTKLYLLIRLSPKHLTALLARKRHRIPESGKLRTLAGMTVAELITVLRALTGRGRELPAADRAFASYRRGVNALVAAMDELTRHRASVAVAEVREVHATLVAAAAALAASFGLPPM
jgi:hypothetical protein